MTMRRSTSRHIVLIAYEGVSLLDLSGPLEAFRVAAAFAPVGMKEDSFMVLHATDAYLFLKQVVSSRTTFSTGP
jgi:transcriptional regulator GlxA family with amidase domain